jgi:hypothetical protein
MDVLPKMHRRDALTLLGAPLLPVAPLLASLVAPATAAAAAAYGVRTDQITVLYRPTTADAPSRLDPAVQTAIRQLERQFIQQGLKVLQPSAEIYRLMDQGQGVVVTFAADAGFSLVFSAYKNLRPDPRQDGSIAEMRIESRVNVGRNVLSAEEGRGQMFTRTDPASREFGERRALEVAAGKAAEELAEKTAEALKALTPESIAQMLGPAPSQTTQAEIVYVPPAGGAAKPPESPPSPAPVIVAPPNAAPAPAPAVAAAPVAEPAAPLPPPRSRHALVVGMSSYAPVRANGVSNINDLPGVAKDVVKVVQTLRSRGFADEQIKVLRDGQATSKAVREAMRRLAGTVQSDDLVLIFISAHGGDKEFSASGFGMPILADYGQREASTLDFWELQSYARNLKGKVLWISDTCHSGGAASNITSVVVGGSGVQASSDVRGPNALEVARQSAPGQDFAILTASSPHEISWETGNGGGLFTSKLFDAMASGGEEPLAALFAQRVQRSVVEESRRICIRANACREHPQQTPVMAFGGAGNRIRL